MMGKTWWILFSIAEALMMAYIFDITTNVWIGSVGLVLMIVLAVYAEAYKK